MRPSDPDKALHEAEQWVDRLRSLYDQFLDGSERLEPIGVRREAEQRLDSLRTMELAAPGQRFRFENLQQRYLALKQYWTRSMREPRNAGSVRKERQQGTRRRRNTGSAGFQRPGGTIEVEISAAEVEALEQDHQLPVPAEPSRKRRILPPESELRLLHKKYMDARKRNGEHTQILFESMVKKLRASLPTLEKQFGGHPVTFHIGLEEGKVVLEAAVRAS